MSIECYPDQSSTAYPAEQFALHDVQFMHAKILEQTGVMAHAKNVLAAKRAATYDELIFDELEEFGFYGENELTRVSVVARSDDNPFENEPIVADRYPETICIRFSQFVPGLRNGLGGWFHEYVNVYTSVDEELDQVDPNFDAEKYKVVKALADGLKEDRTLELLPNLKPNLAGVHDPAIKLATMAHES